jgi:hypothetical protein
VFATIYCSTCLSVHWAWACVGLWVQCGRYGLPNVVTTVSSVSISNKKLVVSYYRLKFRAVVPAGSTGRGVLQLVMDDGGLVHINGQRVAVVST